MLNYLKIKQIKRINYTSEILIYFSDNIKMKANKLTLLDKSDIQKLDKIHYKNMNYLSDNSISKILKLNTPNSNCKNKDVICGGNNMKIEDKNFKTLLIIFVILMKTILKV